MHPDPLQLCNQLAADITLGCPPHIAKPHPRDQHTQYPWVNIHRPGNRYPIATVYPPLTSNDDWQWGDNLEYTCPAMTPTIDVANRICETLT